MLTDLVHGGAHARERQLRFLAGVTDGCLFYDGAGGMGGTGTFNAEITLTGQNSTADLRSNDIVSSTLA